MEKQTSEKNTSPDKPKGSMFHKKNGDTKRKINPWKVAFITLLAFLTGLGIFLTMRINTPREAEDDLRKQELAKGETVLEINTHKQQVNQLIDHFLNEFLEDSEVKYDFYLKNEALLTGEFKFFNHPVDFYLYFDPYVMENGDIQLKAKSLSIGSLNLPITDVLGMVKSSYDLPEWVEVNKKEKNVILHLDELKMATGLYVRAEKINLIDDEIRFSLYYPGETSDDTTSSSERND